MKLCVTLEMCVILLRNCAITYVFAGYFRFSTYSRLFLGVLLYRSIVQYLYTYINAPIRPVGVVFMCSTSLVPTLVCLARIRFSRDRGRYRTSLPRIAIKKFHSRQKQKITKYVCPMRERVCSLQKTSSCTSVSFPNL